MEDERIKTQMIKWAINTNLEIELEEWEHLWKHSIRISACSAIQENCYKLKFRWHLTLKKPAKIYKTMSNRCWKCSQTEGSFYHQWWTCPQVKKWRKFGELEKNTW